LKLKLKLKSLFLIAVLGILGACQVRSQSLPVNEVDSNGADSSSFQTIRFAIGPVVIPFQRNVSGWESSPGIGFSAFTPFFRGELLLGVTAIRWETTEIERPDFLALHLFGGWSLSTPERFPVKIASGFKVGNYFMAFDSNQIAGERNESELAMSLVVSIRRTLYRNLEGFAEGEATRVFTLPKMDLVGLRVGLSLKVGAPAWLKTVAR